MCKGTLFEVESSGIEMYHVNTNYYFYKTVRQDPQKRRAKWSTVTVRLKLTSDQVPQSTVDQVL